MELFVADRREPWRRWHSQSSRRASFTTRGEDMNSQTATALAVPVNAKDHLRGAENAPVTLVEYGDYECPHCGQAHYVVQQFERTLADSILFVFRNFPLTTVHPHAELAAEAAE